MNGKTLNLTEWLRRRDTEYVPAVRLEEDLRRNISDGTPFGQALQEMVLRDVLGRLEYVEKALRNPGAARAVAASEK